MPPINPHTIYQPLYFRNEPLITSCTHRLLQLQSELQTKHLKQQLISSLAMKELSLMKLIEEQNILIMYLKDELSELEVGYSQGINMEKNIVEMQQKYLALAELKSIDLADGQRYLAQLKSQYNELHQVLNQLTKESSTLYELKLKHIERNTLTKGILTQKISEYCQVKQQHQHESNLNQIRQKDNTMLRNQIQKNTPINTSMSQQLNTKTKQLQSNQLKLVNLQKQVQKYQEEKNILLDIQQAAFNDNKLLTQTLKDKIQLMKQKETQLTSLNENKQSLQKKNIQQNQRLNSSKKQCDHSKDNLVHQKSKGQSLKSIYETTTKDKFTAQQQLQRLQHKRITLQSLIKQSLTSCLQNQQTLQKNIYYIDQYMLINSQLLNQIQILLNQDISKSNLQKIHFRSHYKKDRSYQIIQLQKFLSSVTEQMHNTERNLVVLVRDFSSYKIC